MAIYFLEQLSLEQCHLSRAKLLPQCGACLSPEGCGQAPAAVWDLSVWARFKPGNWEGLFESLWDAGRAPLGILQNFCVEGAGH